MINIPDDLIANYNLFSTDLPERLNQNACTFRGKKELVESYARIAALNSLKIDLIEHQFPSGAAEFFFEAHNDALLSHANASIGSWRPALQCLRSFLENTLAAIYYLDHPIEFNKWQSGDFQIAPKQLREYVCEHPLVVTVSKELGLKASLDVEYATLSKAVHGSNCLFRMTTTDGKTSIGTASFSQLSKWAKRERETINICVLLIVSVLQKHLDGAKMPELRQSLRFPLSSKSRSVLKSKLGITILEP